MLGQPVSMLIPQVVGLKLIGELPQGSTATDLDHRKRQRHVYHGVADGGGGLTEPQKAELPLLKSSEPAHASSLDACPCGTEVRFYPAAGNVTARNPCARHQSDKDSELRRTPHPAENRPCV